MSRWNQTGTGSGSRPLIEHWNGPAWAKQTSVIPPRTGYDFLFGVSCPVKGTCTSVGVCAHSSQMAASPLAEQNS